MRRKCRVIARARLRRAVRSRTGTGSGIEKQAPLSARNRLCRSEMLWWSANAPSAARREALGEPFVTFCPRNRTPYTRAQMSNGPCNRRQSAPYPVQG